MLEFLQPFVDAVARAVPAVAAKKERDASAKLGSELFLIYVQFNEALVLAEQIVGSLETYVARMSEHVRTGDDRYALTAGDWVMDDVHQQVRNLTHIRERITGWRWHLQVLDGRSSNELRFLLDRKLSALHVLSRAVERQRMPLRTTGVLIDEHGTLQVGRDPIAYHELEDQLAANSVPMDRPWTADVLARVEHYLAARKPREQLAEIRDSLEKIRAALEANFTVTDILLRAGDPRAGRRRGFGP